MKIGIIGFGAFGTFISSILEPYGTMYAYDPSSDIDSSSVTPMQLDDVGQIDILILSIPLSEYEKTLVAIKPLLRPDTLVVDVCSVKVKSRDVMLRILEGHENILVCHPLFGPQTVKNGLDLTGHDIIVTNIVGGVAEQCVEFFDTTLKLRVHKISAEEHDHVMAYVHVLTFFVARGLGNMHIADMPFKTPSYDMITALTNFDAKHTNELFMTIQEGNPYADVVRRKLLASFEDLENELIAEKEK